MRPALTRRDVLELDYQQLRVDSENIIIGWIYNLSTCEVDHFLLEYFNFSNGIVIDNAQPISTLNSTSNTVTIPISSLADGIYFRLSVIDGGGMPCGTDTGIRHTYYSLYTLQEGVENVYGPLDGSVSIRIPNTFSEGEMATPSLVWPARPGVPGDCYCPPYENLTLVKFSDCLITCETSYSIRSDSESIHFTNLTSQMNNTPVHFVTLTDQCDFPDCFIRTIVASYKIIVVGPPDPPDILYSSNNDTICLTAYSNPRYPVLFHNVTVTTLSENIMRIVNSSQQCLSLRDLFPDGCESFTVSASSGNTIGTSQTSYLSDQECENPPDTPNVTFISDSICFNASSNFPVEYYIVNVTDATGLDTSLSGEYTIPQCLNITSDLFPDVCAPFQVTVTAANAFGTSESITFNTPSGPIDFHSSCDCYQQKEQVDVVVLDSSNSTVIIIIVSCGLNETEINFILQLQQSDLRVINATCNENTTITDLASNEQYFLIRRYTDNQQCTITHFNTTRESTTAEQPATRMPCPNCQPVMVIVLAVVFSVLLLAVIVVVVVIIVCSCIHRRTKPHDPYDQKLEESIGTPPVSPSKIDETNGTVL